MLEEVEELQFQVVTAVEPAVLVYLEVAAALVGRLMVRMRAFVMQEVALGVSCPLAVEAWVSRRSNLVLRMLPTSSSLSMLLHSVVSAQLPAVAVVLLEVLALIRWARAVVLEVPRDLKRFLRLFLDLNRMLPS